MGVDAVCMMVFFGMFRVGLFCVTAFCMVACMVRISLSSRVVLRFLSGGMPVRTGAGEQFDSVAQIHDLFRCFQFVQQSGFEIDKSRAEDRPGPVEPDKLPRRRFEGLRTGSWRYQYFDREIVSDDALYDMAQRKNRYVECIFIGRLSVVAAGCEQ